MLIVQWVSLDWLGVDCRTAVVVVDGVDVWEM